MDVGLVCDACSAFSPMGASDCVRCGEPVSLDPPRASTDPNELSDDDLEDVDDAGGQPSVGGNLCPTCDVMVTPGHRFCFNCGGKMPAEPRSAGHSSTGRHASQAVSEFADVHTQVSRNLPKPGARPTLFFGAMQAARAKLTLIRGDGLDGVSFTLAGDEHLAGRHDVPLLFPDDPFLSPVHANFFYRDKKLIVRDEGSVNGIFVRIVGGIEVPFSTRFLVGEQVLEVQKPGVPGEDAEADGTYYFASPKRRALFRVVQTLRGGDVGRAIQAESEVITVGREGNDIDFPEDPFISGQHAQLSWKAGKIMLTDLTSRNGTFVKVASERELKHGDYVFMGQQLLRVEIV